MGMYDTISHQIKCPNCGNDIKFTEQVKWTNDCSLADYRVGDKIDAADGEYDWATWIRPELVVDCRHYRTKIHYKIVVKDGILSEIKIIS